MNSGKDRQHAIACTVATVAAVAVILGACFACAWQSGALLPGWVRWSSVEETADLNADGLPDTVVTASRRLSIVDGTGRRCQASADWLISDAHVGDVTRDGTPDVIAIAWKRGRFGTSKPFWVQRDDTSFSQHVYIFDYVNGQLKQVWMSSALGFEAHSSSLDADGRLHLIDGRGAETVWEWQSWGLALAHEAAPDETDRTGANQSATRDGEGDSGDDSESRKPQTLTLIATGDVIAHGSMIVDAQSGNDGDRQSHDFSPLFSRIKDRISSFDIAAANQETPFVNDPSRFAGWPQFGTPTALGDALADAGFDVVTAATNHANDQGETGLGDTIGFWRNEHPEVTLLGLHDSSAETASCDYLERNGVKVALLNACYGLNGNMPPAESDYEIDLVGDGARLAERATEAESEADATICFLHIGDEYSATPSTGQRALCELLIDAGADVIICSHPHVLQPAETVRTESGAEGVVFWSLGNFASNQLRPETVLGGAAELTFEKTGGETSISSYALTPTVCHFERGLTQVFWLDDYTDELARRHYINTLGDENAVTLGGLRAQFTQVATSSQP